MKDLKKTALITGVTHGIGKATARKFLEEGWFVVGTSTAKEFPAPEPNMQILHLDYLDSKSISAAGETVARLNHKLDLLVNNAAVFLDKIGDQIEIEALRKTLEVNLIGTIDWTERLIPLIKGGGKIINMSSMAGSLTDPIEWSWITPAYKISKAGLNMYTKVLGRQLKDRNIIVCALDPGWVKTRMGGEEAPRSPEEAAADIYNLATSEVETGQFWREGKKRNW